MGLSYAGIDLLLPSAELKQWLDAYLATDDLHLFGCEPASVRSPITGTRNDNLLGVGLPLPNYPPPPPTRINSLWWPTGATRWARGVFLANGTDKERLDIYAKGQLPNLVLSDGIRTVAAPMHMLAPRPIADFSQSVAENLWLIPLVDERYLWQFRDMGNYEPGDLSDWESLFDLIETALGKTIELSDIDRRYLYPDRVEFYRPYSNPAVLLDAAAHSVGHRIVLAPTITVANGYGQGTFPSVAIAATTLKSQNASDAIFTDNSNTAENYEVVTGHYWTLGCANLPNSVSVTFPKTLNGAADDDGARFARESYICGSAGDTKVIQSSCYANYHGSATNPTNLCRLAGLAEVIREDFVSWSANHGDVTLVGIAAWEPSGFDNFVEWQAFSMHDSGGGLKGTTRVQTLPADFGAEQSLQQDYCSTTTTTTTTTSTTPEPVGCSGRCKWIWSDSGQYWSLDTDGCATSTSTTTSTTSTTLAADDPCRCDATTTADPGSCGCATSTTTTTSTTSTTTTTTADPCSCTYPTFCGVAEGDCTYTYCAAGYTRLTVACTSTTTSTTTTTFNPSSTTSTTTTCDCNTTTTTTYAPDCVEGCCFVWAPDELGYYGWVNVTNGCNTVTCPCPEPDHDGEDCELAYTACRPTTTTPEPNPNERCRGSCEYYGMATTDCDGNTISKEWILLRDGCLQTVPCYCVAPSVPPDSCGIVSIPCQSPIQTTTTTAAPSPTCANCYTTTTTSTTSTTTTTTANPCGDGCLYRFDGVAGWLVQSMDCTASCYCDAPPLDPEDSESCELAHSPCVPTTTTTTTTTTTPHPFYCYTVVASNNCYIESLRNCAEINPANPANIICSGPYATYNDCVAGCDIVATTTTTTTTTTPLACDSTCGLICNGDGVWDYNTVPCGLYVEDCIYCNGTYGVGYGLPCSPVDATATGTCQDTPPTTTTAAPTTTTTTTSTTPHCDPWPAGDCYCNTCTATAVDCGGFNTWIVYGCATDECDCLVDGFNPAIQHGQVTLSVGSYSGTCTARSASYPTVDCTTTTTPAP